MAGVECRGLQRFPRLTVAGVLSNPFGVGLLDASPTAAADYTSGAHMEEAAGRAMGASNAAEAAQMRQQGRDIPLWQGGFIHGFADGGGIRIPSFAMGGDEISDAEEKVADAELAVQQHPKSKSAKDNLALAKNELAKLKAQKAQASAPNTIRIERGRNRNVNRRRRPRSKPNTTESCAASAGGTASAEKQAAQEKAKDQQLSRRVGAGDGATT